MIEVGRLCVKTAGRDAGKKCVVLNIIDNNNVLIDGQTRRRKCNISHLEPLETKIKISKKAPHSDIVKEFKKIGIKVKEKIPKEKPKEKKEEKKQ